MAESLRLDAGQLFVDIHDHDDPFDDEVLISAGRRGVEGAVDICAALNSPKANHAGRPANPLRLESAWQNERLAGNLDGWDAMHVWMEASGSTKSRAQGSPTTCSSSRC
jgi:hypothetical protein